MRNHSWRRPAPSTPEGEVVAWADRIAYVCHDFEDAVRAGILTPDDLPDEVADVVGRSRSRQVGAFVHAVLDAIDRTGHVGMTEPAADGARRVPRLQLRPDLPAARGPAPGREGRRPAAAASSTSSSTRRTRLPAAATGMHADLAPGSLEAAAVAVRYVSGMTDRYALGLGVELLGWRPEDLPRGV